MRFIDKSVDEDGQDESISCHFFMKEGDMPHARCGDVLILHQVRVCDYLIQIWLGYGY